MSEKNERPVPRFPAAEFLVVALVVVVVALVVLPRLQDAAERARAEEAFSFLEQVRRAQDRHEKAHGAFASRLADLRIDDSLLEHFRAGGIELAGPEAGWRMTLTRAGGDYGDYTVVFDRTGFDRDSSTISKRPEILPRR